MFPIAICLLLCRVRSLWQLFLLGCSSFLRRGSRGARRWPGMLLTPPDCSCLQATESVTAGSASATLVTSGTTATAPPRQTAVFPAMGRCAVAGAPASVGSVSALSRGLLERRVRSVPPAQASVALKGTHEGVQEGLLAAGNGSSLVPARLFS